MPASDSPLLSPTGVHIGHLAPDFQLLDSRHHLWKLRDHRGKVVVLLFYPKDQTPVCTRQMCGLRDHWPEYLDTQAEIVGISIDTVRSHVDFSQRHHLPQRLLADTDGRVTTQYQLKSWLGGAKRAVIILDKEGVIRFRRTWLPIFRPDDQDLLTVIREISLRDR